MTDTQDTGLCKEIKFQYNKKSFEQLKIDLAGLKLVDSDANWLEKATAIAGGEKYIKFMDIHFDFGLNQLNLYLNFKLEQILFQTRKQKLEFR